MSALFFLYAISTLPLSKLLLTHMQPWYLIGLRMLIAGICMLAYRAFARQSISTLLKKHYGALAHIAFWAILVPYYLRYWGLQHGVQPRADLLCFAGPFITYMVTGFLTLERFTRIKTVSLALGYCGLLISWGRPLSAYMTPLQWADGALLLSVMSFSYGWLRVRELVVDHHCCPIAINAITMTSAGIIALCIAWYHAPLVIVGNGIHCFLLLAVVIGISNLFAHNLYGLLLKRYSLTLMQLASFSVPLFACYRNSIGDGQACTMQLVGATIVILMAIGLFNYDEQTISQENYLENNGIERDIKE